MYIPQSCRLSERIGQAFRRARIGVGTVGLTYVLSVLVGMGMVHGGNRFALGYRDRLVGKARRESVILRNFQECNRLRAAGLDAAGNAAPGAVSLVAGYFPPSGSGIAAFRGWIGGIVSVDGLHHSRVNKPGGAFYVISPRSSCN